MKISKHLGVAYAALMIMTGGAFAEDMKLTDGQIVQIAHASGMGEIEASKLALTKSKNADVLTFAREMVADHQAVDREGGMIAKKNKLGMAPSDTSKALMKENAQKKADLSKLRGAEFDKAYAELMVSDHKAVLDLLDDKLIPAATNAELKAHLTKGQEKFTMHEEHAEHLLQKVKAIKSNNG